MNEPTELRLLIVAGDPLARTGLAALLANQSPCRVVGQIDGGDDLLTALEVYQPDLILWDLGWDPSAALEQLPTPAESGLPLVLLLPDEEQAALAWTVAPHGMLLREAEAARLVAALQAAAQGLITLEPSLASALLPSPSGSPPALIEPLTPRELEVLQHLAEGLPNKGIAHRLKISEHTVKFHVNAIMGKLTAQSRTEAVVKATQLGLILL